MRVFFALWPDADVRARLAGAAADLSSAVRGVRWVPQENYHLTVLFIGAASAAEVAALRQIGAAQRGRCCSVILDRCEVWARSQVLVACAGETPAALLDWWTRLRGDVAGHSATRASACVGVEPPPRPHVTLARKVTQATVPQAMSPFCWTARSFSLVRSDRSAAGSVYTVVDTWPLLDESAAP